jgi:hypothetical protein
VLERSKEGPAARGWLSAKRAAVDDDETWVEGKGEVGSSVRDAAVRYGTVRVFFFTMERGLRGGWHEQMILTRSGKVRQCRP